MWACGDKGTLVHCWWDSKMLQPMWKTIWKFLKYLCFMYLRAMLLCAYILAISKVFCKIIPFINKSWPIRFHISSYMIFILYSTYQHYNTIFILLTFYWHIFFHNWFLNFLCVCVFVFSYAIYQLHIIGFLKILSCLINTTLKNGV